MGICLCVWQGGGGGLGVGIGYGGRGQLHLASSLDNIWRIQPVSEGGGGLSLSLSLSVSVSVSVSNAALMQHVENEGHNAVALFINALRQSGQLHLASSLDNTRRIQPVSEGGGGLCVCGGGGGGGG